MSRASAASAVPASRAKERIRPVVSARVATYPRCKDGSGRGGPLGSSRRAGKGISGCGQGCALGLGGDLSGLDQLFKMLVECLGSEVLPTIGHESLDLTQPLRVLQAFAHSGCADQDLDCSHPTIVILLGKELLRNNRANRL